MEKEYIVGIDWGHGETAAWIMPVYKPGDTAFPDGHSARLRRTNDVQGRVRHTVIYKNGDDSYSLIPKAPCKLLTNLKKHVSSPEFNADALAAYARQIVELLLQHNSELKVENGETNFYICMACPTRWTDNERTEYLAFFNRAIAPLGFYFDWIINESDAAFFTHASSVEASDRVVLVIDYGSSTIDYTVLRDGKKISDDSWSNEQLGASMIERTILQHYRRSAGDEFDRILNGTQIALQRNNCGFVAPLPWIQYELRKIKERNYTDGQDHIRLEYHLGVASGIDINEFSDFRFNFDGSLAEIITKYREEVRADFRKLADHIAKATGSRHIDRIILSGGACIMNWVRDDVREILADPDNPSATAIVEDDAPQFVVAHGIAKYFYAQQKALQLLLRKIDTMDFPSIYRQADIAATNRATDDFSNAVVASIRETPNCTAAAMRNKFIDMMRSMGPDNAAYTQIFTDEFFRDMTDRVRNALRESIRETFGVDLPLDDFRMPRFALEITRWDEESLSPGGGIYEKINNAIIASKDSFSFIFKWDKPRTDSERNDMATFIRARLVHDMRSVDFTYAFDIAALAASCLAEIKRTAADLFYRHQLFRTTFE